VSKLKAIIDSGIRSGIDKSQPPRQMPDEAARQGIRAYHGSPYNFPPVRELEMPDGAVVYQSMDDAVPEGARVIKEHPLGRFDMSKIGTGEGAQAYSRGLYFAEREATGQSYRDTLSRDNLAQRAKDNQSYDTLVGLGLDESPELGTFSIILSEADGDMARAIQDSMTPRYPDDPLPAFAQSMADAMKSGRLPASIELPTLNKGSMYEVNIAATPDEFIDWDLPLDEQSESVMNALNKTDWYKYAEEGAYEAAGNRGDNPYGMDLVRYLEEDGAEDAAQMLKDAGIKGVQYADAQTRFGKGPKTKNYVVFDDKLIDIAKKYGVSIPVAYMMIQSEDAEAGMLDLGLRTLRGGMNLAEKAPAQFNRGARNMAKRVFLSPQERSAIEASLGGDSELAINIARDWKKRHPNSDWAQPNITGAKLTKDKKVELKFKSMPYAYNIDPKTGKQVKPGSAQFKKISDGVADEVIDYFKRAENPDDLSARNVINNAGWYKNVEGRLRAEYGSFSEMMGDLLGATSPNTPVATNFRFTKDILDGFARGEFDELMEGFADSLDKRYALEDQAAAFLEAEKATGRKAKDIKEDPAYTALIDESKNIAKELRDKRNIIKQRNGKLFGINSYNAMVALADKFRIRRVGSAPKAKNFAGNLVGSSQEATIDVWSARNLRRHSGRKPIPSSAEKGVTGKIVDPENFVSNLEFGFGQSVIRDATDKINQFIGPEHPLYPLGPRDVQALQWFAEKDLWTRKGWTSKAGEGGSFEQMLDADPVESLVLGLSREQSMENQGRDFVPTSDQMLESMSTILKPANTDPDVVTYKGLPTGGAYMGTPETALDVNIVSREDFIPVDTLDLAAVQAAEDLQQSWFVARRIKDDLGASRPEMFTVGTEIYFDGPKLANNNLIQDISDYLLNNGIPAYTMIVDPRDANSVIGLRVLDIPQLSGDSKKYATMSKDEYKDTVRRTYDEFGNLGRNLEKAFGQIKSATPAYFDVNIKSLADTQDYLGQYGNTARDPEALRQEFYGFKPAQERFRQWEGQSFPYYRENKGPDSTGGNPTGGKESKGIDGLGFKDKSSKALGAGITGLGAMAALPSEEAEAGVNQGLLPFDKDIHTSRDVGLGGLSSEYTMTVDAPDGQVAVIPSIWWDTNGEPVVLDQRDAERRSFEYEQETGKQFPRFPAGGYELADEYAQARTRQGGASESPLASEYPSLGGMGVTSRATPDEVAFKAPREPRRIPEKQPPGIASLAGQLGLGAMSEIGGAILGGLSGVGEYVRGGGLLGVPSGAPATGESIRNINEGVSGYVGDLYDAGPEAQALGQQIMQGIGETIAPIAEYAMEGPITDEYGINMLPLLAQKLGIPPMSC
jgi:hypothetical protein